MHHTEKSRVWIVFTTVKVAEGTKQVKEIRKKSYRMLSVMTGGDSNINGAI